MLHGDCIQLRGPQYQIEYTKAELRKWSDGWNISPMNDEDERLAVVQPGEDSVDPFKVQSGLSKTETLK